MATVTLDKVQRDGLHRNVGMMLDGDSLESPTSENEAEVKDIVRQLPVCCAVLDQIGWDEHGDRDSYTLEVDEGTAAAVSRMVRWARGFVADEVYYLESDPGNPERERSLSDARSTLVGLLAIAAAGGALVPAGAA
jgi:hypothetical protein